MNTENNSGTRRKVDPSLAPFVVEFTLAIIMTLLGKQFVRPKREVIHAEMVPRVTKEVMHASMRPSIIPPRRIMMPARRVAPPPMPAPIPKPIPEVSANPELAWTKIQALLQDPTVSSIECPGPGRQLMVIRAGRRQITRIVYSGEEIKFILESVSEYSHIPILEGVFRAAMDNFSIHAVISEMIGSKFVIKKNSPYSMIEQ